MKKLFYLWQETDFSKWRDCTPQNKTPLAFNSMCKVSLPYSMLLMLLMMSCFDSLTCIGKYDTICLTSQFQDYYYYY